MKYMLSPLRYTGSKRFLLPQIERLFPIEYDTYYEPFVGGANVTQLAFGHKIVISDINQTVTSFWKMIKEDPKKLINGYTDLWKQGAENIYYQVRDRYNQTKDPIDFYFLTKTSYNGLVRFNSKGEFNAPYDVREMRKGRRPDSVAEIAFQWSEFFINNDIEIHCSSYEWILDRVGQNDFVFLDPPYMSCKKSGSMYFTDTFNLDSFIVFLRELNNIGCKWLLTFDGKSDTKGKVTDKTENIPEDVYKSHEYFEATHSIWKKDTKIYESYYKNY